MFCHVYLQLFTPSKHCTNELLFLYLVNVAQYINYVDKREHNMTFMRIIIYFIGVLISTLTCARLISKCVSLFKTLSVFEWDTMLCNFH